MVEPDIPDHEKNQINILLNEYQACHRNRNNYDSVRWTIGSIFIGASLTLFGISLAKEIELMGIFIACLFSLLLIMIWYLYSQHVNPYVISSIIRAQDIENDLKKRGYGIELHRLIKSLDPKNKKGKTGNEVFNIKGTTITFLLVLTVISMWSFRTLIPLFPLKNLTESLVFALVLSITFVLPLGIFCYLRRKFNDKIEDKIRNKLQANKKAKDP